MFQKFKYILSLFVVFLSVGTSTHLRASPPSYLHLPQQESEKKFSHSTVSMTSDSLESETYQTTTYPLEKKARCYWDPYHWGWKVGAISAGLALFGVVVWQIFTSGAPENIFFTTQNPVGKLLKSSTFSDDEDLWSNSADSGSGDAPYAEEWRSDWRIQNH